MLRAATGSERRGMAHSTAAPGFDFVDGEKDTKAYSGPGAGEANTDSTPPAGSRCTGTGSGEGKAPSNTCTTSPPARTHG